MNQAEYVPLETEIIINFIINKFKEIHILTSKEQWKHARHSESVLLIDKAI